VPLPSPAFLQESASFLYFSHWRLTKEELGEWRGGNDQSEEQKQDPAADLECKCGEARAQPFVPDGMSASHATTPGAEAFENRPGRDTLAVQAIDTSPLRVCLLSGIDFLSPCLPLVVRLFFLFKVLLKLADESGQKWNLVSYKSNLDIRWSCFCFRQCFMGGFEFLFGYVFVSKAPFPISHLIIICPHSCFPQLFLAEFKFLLFKEFETLYLCLLIAFRADWISTAWATIDIFTDLIVAGRAMDLVCESFDFSGYHR
jgi:hypothetical protein